MNPETMTHAERVLRLASLEEKGRPRFAMLRKECRGDMDNDPYEVRWTGEHIFCNCERRGRVVDRSLEALLEAAGSVMLDKSGKGWVAKLSNQDWTYRLPTPNEALSLALVRATVALQEVRK